MWLEVVCLIDRVWSSKECACYACDPSVHLSVPSIFFLFLFALLMLFLCVILQCTSAREWSVRSYLR